MAEQPERVYELQMEFEPHVATVHLGSQKYSTPTRALGELVANALDAQATCIEIQLRENDLGGLESIVVSDDGCGISPDILESRFRLVGSLWQGSSGERLGRFGIGRLAVHRIGTASRWVTVVDDGSGHHIESSFLLDTEKPKSLRIVEKPVPRNRETGTRIEIYNLLSDALHGGLTPSRIAGDLLTQFCSYLLVHPERQIVVQGQVLDVWQLVESAESETIPADGVIPTDVRIDHLLLRTAVDRSRFPAQLLLTGKGRTVFTSELRDPPAPQYLGIAESQYLDDVVTSNREGLIELDAGFQAVLNAVAERVEVFRRKLRAERSGRFLDAARREDYYPFSRSTNDPIRQVEKAVFDVVLERVNEHANVAGMTKTQQKVVFRLLQRALENENLLDILSEVAALSDSDVERFRKVLEKTTLNSIINLSAEVTDRLQFLDILHELVYGDLASVLKERTQLHRILEPHGWLFGPMYHLATSDKGFREVIRRHRALAGLGQVDEADLRVVDGINKIPDLFLAATKEYPTAPRHHHLLVEIKAPKVDLGAKEREQIRRYAEIIRKSDEFDKRSVHWNLYLVSSAVSEEIEEERTQSGREHGVLFMWPDMTVWAFSWSEIITSAREELRTVRDHLEMKSKELAVSEYLKQEFPEILTDLQMKLAG